MRLLFAVLFFSFVSSVPVGAQYSLNVKRTLNETNHKIFWACYSHEGNYIVTTGSDNNVIIWNAETGIIYRTIVDLKKRQNIAMYSENNKLIISGGEDQKATVWDPVTMEIKASFKGHHGAIKSLDLSQDGRYLATGSADHTIRIWDIDQKKLIYELKAHKKDVNSVQFSSDGKKLISGGADRRIIMWSMMNGNILASKDAHKGWIRDLTFSPDGNMIASCGDDKLIHLWKAEDLSKVRTLSGHKAWVQTIDFSPDGRHMISGGHDQVIILWEVESGEVLYQTEKQGQIVLSVDISPKRADLISSSLLSENLKTWALSGLEGKQWETGSPAISLKNKITDIPETEDQQEIKKTETIADPEKQQMNPKIEIFSPIAEKDRIVCDKNEILIIGKVSDPEGINTFLINKTVVKPLENGVFQFNLNLVERENRIQLIAINNSGKMSEKWLVIDCMSADPLVDEPAAEILKSVYYALIIGISDYQDENISDLDNPIKDTEAINEVLQLKYTFDKNNIIFLRNPTRTEMITVLDELGRKLTVNDNLLIFYAGHGYWDDRGKVGYWFPSDASRNNTANWFRNSTLRDFIGSIQTRHTLLIADACFSGAIFKTRSAFTEPSKGIEKLYELPSRRAMTSGILQEVPDESIFVQYLLKRLEENEEQFLSSEILFSSFKTAVMNNSPNVPQFGIIQNVGHEGGDFIFIKR